MQLNINDLYNDSKDAEDTGGFAPLLDETALPGGVPVLTEITFSMAAKTSKGAPKYKVKLAVIEEGHEHKGGEVFDNLNFSAGDGNGNFTDGQKGYNKRLFGKLMSAGLSEAFWAASPSEEAIAEAVKGKKIILTPKWEEPTTNAKGNPVQYLDNNSTWEPADGSSAVSSTGY